VIICAARKRSYTVRALQRKAGPACAYSGHFTAREASVAPATRFERRYRKVSAGHSGPAGSFWKARLSSTECGPRSGMGYFRIPSDAFPSRPTVKPKVIVQGQTDSTAPIAN
jgi:hypothetical protein